VWRRIPADVLLIVVVSIWSVNLSVNRYGVTHGFHPLVFAGIRYLGAGIIFTTISLKREGSIRPRREDWLVLGVYGILGMAISQIAFFSAARLTTASTIALVFGTLPAFVVMIGLAQGLERPSIRTALGVVVSIGGVALVALGGGVGLSGNLGGVLLTVLSAGMYAFYIISIARLNTSYSPYRLSALISFGVAVPSLIGGSHGFATMDWGSIGWLAWGALAFSSLFGFVVSNVLWIKGVEGAGANRSSIYANLQVFGGAVVGVLLLGETLSGMQIVGGCVIGAGILLSLKRFAVPSAPVVE
jgi:drug/metabolite transporter (DMT)-like permease